ncbi:RNA polymerase sigma factor RpoH [Bradyrhizobium sp. JYMT SZCCT0428]|uniref:RNA polymerase sigma factor RpoH n=1 Tax=Bradyrhizobium sp. JYMT SZCCT0428 TaxID=2807673 RepID=UPI001BA9E010|nr:RNA polymerase sigma factor RpoH [Bradyrhizobium sp. JYMT SZCCT0428]MBR1153957.1 RNA polymerase sigma factor RpoH [Bradyrhizobium sp. JYMT SZCCT0428]
MANARTLPALSGGLAHYLTEIRKFPLLTWEDEVTYARRCRDQNDREAAYQLVTSHLRLVAKIAMRYRGYGLPVADIISEGNVGLMIAVKRFDPDSGFRLATYAMWWIKAHIQDYILRTWSLVKIGASSAQKKLFFKLRQTKARISAPEDGDLRPEHVQLLATRLQVNEQEVIDMDRRLRGDVSLNVPVNNLEEAGDWQDWLVDPTASPQDVSAEDDESGKRRRALAEALKMLSDRERDIIQRRHMADEAENLDFFATKYGISRERVRQIETRALAKLTKSVKDRFAKHATQL